MCVCVCGCSLTSSALRVSLSPRILSVSRTLTSTTLVRSSDEAWFWEMFCKVGVWNSGGGFFLYVYMCVHFGGGRCCAVCLGIRTKGVCGVCVMEVPECVSARSVVCSR